MAINPLSGLNLGQTDNEDTSRNIPTIPNREVAAPSILSGLNLAPGGQPRNQPAVNQSTLALAPLAQSDPVAPARSNQPNVTLDDLTATKAESALGGVVKGLGEIAAGTVRGVGNLGFTAAQTFAPERTAKFSRGQSVSNNDITQFGDKISSFFADSTNINPEFQDTNLQRVSEGLGSAAGFIAGGLGSAALKIPAWIGLGSLGVAVGSDQQVKDYIATIESQGGIASSKTAGKAAVLGGALGSLEAIPFTKSLNRLDGATGGLVSDIVARKIKGKVGRAIGEAFQGGLEELTQEAIQQAGTNLIASGALKYDPDRNTLNGVGEAAATGGQVGFLINGLMSSIGLRKGGRFEQIAQQQSVESDLQGLNATPDDIKNIARDTKGELLLPLSEGNLPFNDKGVKKLFSKYINLAQLRTSQQDRGADLTRTETNLQQITEAITDLTAVDENGRVADPVKSQDAEEVLRFIAQNEQRFNGEATTPDGIELEEISTEEIDIGGLSTRRKGFISKEARDNAKEFQDFLQRSAEEKGFTLDNVVEEIDLSSTNIPGESIESESSIEEIVIEDPLTIALRERGLSEQDIALGNIPDSDLSALEDIIAEDVVSPEDRVNRPEASSSVRDALVQAQKNKSFRDNEVRNISEDSDLIDSDLRQIENDRRKITEERRPSAFPSDTSTISDTTDSSGLQPSNSSFVNTASNPDGSDSNTSSTRVANDADPAAKKLGEEKILQESIDLVQSHLVDLQIKQFEGEVVDPALVSQLENFLTDLTTQQETNNIELSNVNLEAEQQSNDIDSLLVEAIPEERAGLRDSAKANQKIKEDLAKGVEKTQRGQTERTHRVGSANDVKVEYDLSDGNIKHTVDTFNDSSGIVENSSLGVERRTGIRVIIDNSNINLNPDIKSYSHTAKVNSEMIGTINNIVSKLNKETADKLVVRHITSLSEVTDPIVIEHINRTGRIPMGLHVPAESSQSGKSEVYTFAGKHENVDQVVNTFMHEVVGHFGMSGLLGKGWDGFLKRAYSSSGAADRIFQETHIRWGHIIDNNPLRGSEKGVRVSFTDKAGNKKSRRISSKAMEKLTDEHIANLAARFSDTSFRNKMSKKDTSLIKRTVALVKHFLRKIGIIRGLKDSDILSVLQNSFSRIFQDPLLDQNLIVRPSLSVAEDLGLDLKDNNIKEGINYNPNLTTAEIQAITGSTRAIGSDKLNTITPAMQERLVNLQLSPSQAAIDMGSPPSDIVAIDRLRTQNFESTYKSAYQKGVTRVGQRISANPLAAKLSSLGKLTQRKEYRRITQKALSKISQTSNNLSDKTRVEFKKLNAEQKQELYNFFTTKEADHTILNMNREMQDLARADKDKITELGEFFRDNGMLTESAFNDNLDSYLPRRYLVHLDSSVGSGKQASFQNYLKKQKDLPAEVRAALGEIKDPAFLVSETIATLSRDAALISMFDTLNQTNQELGLDWVLSNGGDVKTTDLNGRVKTQSIPEAQDRLKDLNKILSFDDGVFQRTDEQTIAVTKERDDLQAAVEVADANQNARLMEAARANGVPEDQVESYRSDNYSQMPDQKRFGKLRGQWVRKEIKQDIKNSSDIFDTEAIESFGGQINKAIQSGHLLWKRLMVPFNLPSWFRNGMGNAALLDISSRRNSLTLNKWLVEEATVAIQGNPSEFWTLAQQQGLFGGTFAANELLDLRRSLKTEFEQSIDQSRASQVFPQFQEAFGHLSELLSQKHGLMEGWFKTVRMRDHLTEWSEQNGRDWRELQGPEREILLGEAVSQSNEAVFDYGDVPNWLNQVRKYPLGSPFLTFTYKAFPQVIRSFARRPQKFIKYAAMPAMMQAAFLASNPDLDEEDYEKLNKGLPKHVQDKAQTYITPWKNANGDFTYIDIGYSTPWGQFMDMGAKSINMFKTDTLPDSLASATTIAGEMTRDLGFLGGPLPAIISSFTTGVDDFTGRPIRTPGASESQKFMESTNYLSNMAIPSWLSDHGTLGRLLNNMGIDAPIVSSGKELTFTGRDKETAGQILPSLAGFNIKSFNPEEARIGNRLGFDRKLREINTLRRKIIKDPNLRNNPAERVLKIREINDRLKRTREEKRKFLAAG